MLHEPANRLRITQDSNAQIVFMTHGELDDLVSWHERRARQNAYAQGYSAGEERAYQAYQIQTEKAFVVGVLVATVFFICCKLCA